MVVNALPITRVNESVFAISDVDPQGLGVIHRENGEVGPAIGQGEEGEAVLFDAE